MVAVSGLHDHHYAARLVWEGNRGEGTNSYAAYGREYRVHIEGKPEFVGSADASFRGDKAKYNPEDLFVIALSSCHMLSYLAICARRGVRVISYEDDARGLMKTDPRGVGKFEEVVLRPRVTIADASQIPLATVLHEDAHRECFIANSVSIPVRHEPTVEVAA